MLKRIQVKISSIFKVSFFSALLAIILYLFIVKWATFKNEIDYKDLISLLINGIFLFYITRFFHKKDDQNRKEKDILIQELIDLGKSIKEDYYSLRASNFPITHSSLVITSLRDNVHYVKELILISEYGIVNTNKIEENFRTIQNKFRMIDRIINPGNGITNNISQDQLILMNSYCQEAIKNINSISMEINKF
ncbi:hypothetical protein CMT75_12335 [Elizabethkingia anophelis]|uniref:hypothetical protein n=1 Tax=Elizabethkingia anophelis TaxID=1117645 RepID=UPI0024E0AB58|nr:hypothetical protein [Elizabethkingia anophelis]MCT4306014.1 hypothetical protein [Elizabethkingia anophelis]MDV3540989.1 hypothetical protein [Elizabethkingia anophelis]MDV3949301.1 hypothetical protein [Elizabethkingia anophelis]HDP3255749.1 hypothetical protein [Elizabethkingia anophelis]